MFSKRLSQDSIIIGAPAKVNLFLEVLRKRDDGYHDINSLFQAVSLFDRLTITRQATGLATISVSLGDGVYGEAPEDESNLVLRAFDLMREHYSLSGSVAVKLEKNIPIAAGLGGGSSDAAATMLALRDLYEIPAGNEELADLGAEIGSDVPFFFGKGQALVTGRGENVTESLYPQDYWLLLVTPRLSVSTGAAYAGLRMELTNPKNPFILPQCGAVTELIDALKLSTNDFEEVHLLSYPELNKIKDGLLHIGALLARMSGSGPTFFGLFDSQPNIEKTLFSEGGDWHVSTVRPITLPIADTSYAGGNRGDHRGTGYTSR